MRTKVINDTLRVIGKGQRALRLEFQGQVLPQGRDHQELVWLLRNLYAEEVYILKGLPAVRSFCNAETSGGCPRRSCSTNSGQVWSG